MNQDIVIQTEIIKHGLDQMLLHVLQFEQQQYQNQKILQTKIEQLGIQTIFLLHNQQLEIQNKNVIVKSLLNNLENSIENLYVKDSKYEQQHELYLHKKNVALIITQQNKYDIYLLFCTYMIVIENKREQWISNQNMSQELCQYFYDLIKKNSQSSQFFESQFMNTNIQIASTIIHSQKPYCETKTPSKEEELQFKEISQNQNLRPLQFLESNQINFFTCDQLQPPPEEEGKIMEFPPENPFQFFSKEHQIKC